MNAAWVLLAGVVYVLAAGLTWGLLRTAGRAAVQRGHEHLQFSRASSTRPAHARVELDEARRQAVAASGFARMSWWAPLWPALVVYLIAWDVLRRRREWKDKEAALWEAVKK